MTWRKLLAKEVEQTMLSQRAVARKAGIAHSHLWNLMYGTKRLTAEVAVKLEKVIRLNCETYLRLQLEEEIAEAREIEGNYCS